jgi:perosamine synthetase
MLSTLVRAYENGISVELRIPYSRTNLSVEDKKLVNEALDSGWISNGIFVDKFSEQISQYFDGSHAVLTSNGTSALALAYLSLGLKPGDEVIFPGFAFMAGANLAKQMNMEAKFSDVSEDTFCMDPQSLLKVITKSTRAVVAVHNYGNTDDIAEIREICNHFSVDLIEDCAESPGTLYNNKKLGTFGEVATFSFHSTKLVACGEGGALITDSEEISNQAELWRSHGIKRRTKNFSSSIDKSLSQDYDYFHELPGNNFRMSNVLAALGYSQMQRIEDEIIHRKSMFSQYEERFSSNFDIQLQKSLSGTKIVPWSVPIRLAPHLSSPEIVGRLRQIYGIESRNGFISANRLSYFGGGELTSAENLSKQVISLPLFAGMNESEVDYVCDSLLACI